MNKLILIAGLLLAIGMPYTPCDGSYLETGPVESGPEQRRIMPPKPPPGNDITRLVDRLTVGRPYATRNMVVFPLYLDGPSDQTHYVTLDTALAHGWLRVYEKGGGVVHQVVVRNDSPHYVFLMAGEIISGARQNRIVRTDTLLRPHGPEVVVPVYCVERGRWSDKTMAFRSEKSMAGNRLRYTAQSKAGQDAVWREVERVSNETGVTSKTSNFQDVVNAKTVQEALSEYAKIMPRPRRGCIGAAIVINNRIAGVEVFANQALFAALWPKVRRAYALDAYPIYKTWHEQQSVRRIIALDERHVRAFLQRIHRARFTPRNGIDLGRLYAIRGNGIGGEGLVFSRSVTHVNFAPEHYIVAPKPHRPVLEHQHIR